MFEAVSLLVVYGCEVSGQGNLITVFWRGAWLWSLALQDGEALPDGPVVISPDGLFPSLYREG